MRDEIQAAESKRKNLETTINSRRGSLGREKDPLKRQQLENEIKQFESSLPEVPVPPRLFADDITPEALAVVMSQHNERISIMESEGGYFDTLAGRYNKGVPNLDLFLKAWNGESAIVDRKNGAPPLHLNNPLLTLCISAQPDVVAGLADKPSFKGRGLLARLLYAIPKSRVGYRAVDSKPIRADVKAAYAEKLLKMLAIQPLNFPPVGIVPLPVCLSPEAEDLRRVLATHIEVQSREGGELESMREWASKLPGNILRVAGQLHCFTHDIPQAVRITRETIYAAIEIASALIQHAKCAFALMGADPNIECAKKILAWLKRTGLAEFSGRDCLNALKGIYRRMPQITAGLTVLEERNYIARCDVPASGRVGRPASPVYRVNPKVFEA
jgi:hypothetical protein